MRYQKPSYFDEFVCIADKCPDTCCAGWQIMIDEDSLERYKNEKGAFGNRLKNSIDWQEECFYQYDGRCAFLNDRNLCDLVTELGEEALCETCARYPRHVEEFEDVREWSLSISCPVAAKLVLDGEKALELTTWEDDKEDPLEEEFEDFDLFLFTKLEDAREKILCKLKEVTLEDADACFEEIYEFSSKLQEALMDNEIWKLDELIEQFGETGKSTLARKSAMEYYQKGRDSFECLSEMEHLRADFGPEVSRVSEYLYQAGKEAYELKRQAFLEAFGEGGQNFTKWQNFKRNLFWFFIYTYFCGAVYDDSIVTKAGMACFAVECVEELVMYHWLTDPENTKKEEWLRLAGALAREVEHSDDNLNYLEDWIWNRWETRERT